MELTKKTTILFPPDLYKKLSALAKQQRVSIGELVRRACEEYYKIASREEILSAVKELGELSLPVGDVREMKEQSVPSAKEIEH